VAHWNRSPARDAGVGQFLGEPNPTGGPVVRWSPAEVPHQSNPIRRERRGGGTVPCAVITPQGSAALPHGFWRDVGLSSSVGGPGPWRGSRRWPLGGFRFQILKELAVALGQSFAQLLRFGLAVPPADDVGLERRLAFLRVPPLAPGLPITPEVLAGQSSKIYLLSRERSTSTNYLCLLLMARKKL
jgi:hypothetical protein